MATYNPKWRHVADSIGISTVVAKINSVIKALQRIESGPNFHDSVSKGEQILLMLKYQELAEKGVSLPFSQVEFRNYSQAGEDGILLYLFSVIGMNNKRCVEICAGVGSECNSANLILKHGWRALLIDGNKEHVEKGRAFFSQHPDSKVAPPVYLESWITRGTVNSILEGAGFSGEIDLLTLDMDGVDYWIWDAIDIVNPRVVVVEYQSEFGEKAITVPYRDDFSGQWVPLTNSETDNESASSGASQTHAHPGLRFNHYGGASLAAFNKLAKRKDYRLVGANSLGHNAFFVRNDIALDFFPEVTELSCHNALYRERKLSPAEELRDFEFEEV